MVCAYNVKRVLEFKNESGKREHFSVGDNIVMIYDDFNDGEEEVRGKIVGIEDSGYLLITSKMSTRIYMYYLSNIKYLTHE